MATLIPLLFAAALSAAPTVTRQPTSTTITGDGWRAVVGTEALTLRLALRAPDGTWLPVAAKDNPASFGWAPAAGLIDPTSARARIVVEPHGEVVTIAATAQVADSDSPVCWEAIATADGLLMRCYPQDATKAQGTMWSPPRLPLDTALFDGYRYWSADGKTHEGRFAALGTPQVFAGVSAWGDNGDTAKSLAPATNAVLATGSRGVALGVVHQGPAIDGARGHAFLQLHTPANLFFYAGFTPASARAWAWLAPFPGDAAQQAARAVRLRADGDRLTAEHKLVPPSLPDSWTRPMPPFPAELRRATPATDPNDPIVYTMAEMTSTTRALELAKLVGSDMLVRGWFKWAQAPNFGAWSQLPAQAHAFGALFGGGITCSALYDTENGITRPQLLEMATRGPDGTLVDAWDQPGTRHGSLSSPAYLSYLFRWCREQIDAGADYLFMDEHTAALGGNEGFDDASVADFRYWLRNVHEPTRGWAAVDPRWRTQYDLDTDNIDTLDYRASLAKSPQGRHVSLWHQCRTWRDDHAWKSLTDRIRTYAAEHGRRVWISANGLARYVDLQVLGVWGNWTMRDGHIDFAEDQLPIWRTMVKRGEALAGRRVPVVLFHDWGFGDTPFPWMAAPVAERDRWMRVRGAEIYAAGGKFAFPVLGPFGCDAAQDGTLATIAQQTRFYQRQRDLYLKGRYLASSPLATKAPEVGLAAWQVPSGLALHVINRRREPQRDIAVSLPVANAPTRVRLVSPDWDGERAGQARLEGDRLSLTVPEVDAYVVALLDYGAAPDISRLAEPTRVDIPSGWARPAKADFTVKPDGDVPGAEAMIATLQGLLHQELRNPPTFTYDAAQPATLRLHVRAVATAGAKLVLRIDGQQTELVDLPDKDGKNDSGAAEYNQVITWSLPAGRHKSQVDNIGGDWAVVDWLAFEGTFRQPQ
ncbi:MAG: hypothetical protein HZB16_12965 [Armatimonadetes bacterium]|nr:hypothetical protein [Armatimonadota bacterium]